MIITKVNPENLTWRTPVLYLFNPSYASGYSGTYFVCQKTLETGSDNDPRELRYLSNNGNWYPIMSEDNGGTYFETIQEVIEVLCQYEINVVGPDEE